MKLLTLNSNFEKLECLLNLLTNYQKKGDRYKFAFMSFNLYIFCYNQQEM